MKYSLRMHMAVLAACDFLATLLAGIAGYALCANPGPALPASAPTFIYFNAVLSVCTICMAGGYSRQHPGATTAQSDAVLTGLTGAFAVGFIYRFFWNTPTGETGSPAAWSFAIAAVLLLVNRRIAVLAWRKSLKKRVERVVIVGASEEAEKLMRAVTRATSVGVAVAGVFDDRKHREAPSALTALLRGTTADLPDYIDREQVDRVVVACAWHASERVEGLLRTLRTIPARIDLLPDELVWRFAGSGMEILAGIPVVPIWNSRIESQLGIVKRLEDIIISCAILLLIWPVLAAVAIAIKLDSKGPAIFRQKRHGYRNHVFEVYKFRTMKTEASGEYDNALFKQATRNDARITRIGHFLRRTSIDELPQFLNVLKGDMSIVGPRPHPLPLNQIYGSLISDYLARHNVKPGITGWAQVHGLRGETDTFDKMHRRLEADLYYIENWSLLLDLKVIFLTAITAWHHETAY